jgi:hypothetical protein
MQNPLLFAMEPVTQDNICGVRNSFLAWSDASTLNNKVITVNGCCKKWMMTLACYTGLYSQMIPCFFLMGYVISQNIRSWSSETAMPQMEFAFPSWTSECSAKWSASRLLRPFFTDRAVHWHSKNSWDTWLKRRLLKHVFKEDGATSHTPWTCMVELSFVFEDRIISEKWLPILTRSLGVRLLSTGLYQRKCLHQQSTRSG